MALFEPRISRESCLNRQNCEKKKRRRELLTNYRGMSREFGRLKIICSAERERRRTGLRGKSCTSVAQA